MYCDHRDLNLLTHSCPTRRSSVLERWVGAAGHPTTFTDRNGTRTARTRSCAALSTATLLSTAPEMFTGSEEEAFQRLRRAAKLTLYGDRKSTRLNSSH